MGQKTNRPIVVPAEGETVERRFRLAAGLATRLTVAAAVAGTTESRIVEAAIEPLLRFRLPDLPSAFAERESPGQAAG